MSRLFDTFRRLKLAIIKSVKSLFTRERIVLTVIAAASLYFIGFSITSMSRNWSLEQTLAEKNREKTVLELEVENVILENRYYASEEYQELSARARQNKIAPGETLIYLPKNTETAKNKHKNDVVAVSPEDEKPSNLSEWLSFLFGI